ncbi:hypothetical protein [Helicobacter sp. T3_23-1059]
MVIKIAKQVNRTLKCCILALLILQMNIQAYSIVRLKTKRAEPVLLPFSFYATNQEIHLAIDTNILCVNDRKEYSLLQYLKDFTATLYLGKIIFEKNKKGILAPKFIPSNLTDSSFEGLNTFWLNEINKNAPLRPKPTMKTPKTSLGNFPILPRPSVDNDFYEYQKYQDENHKYLKIHYFRHKDNIVLTKEQIISYFTQLHQENTEFIANYIESINKNNGINAYHLHNSLFENLTQKGVLPESMIKRYIDTREIIRNNMLDLITLDFLAKTNQPNHKILLYDELFYAYLVWSLREFLIPYFSGRFQEYYYLTFNNGAYQNAKNKDMLFTQNFFSNLDFLVFYKNSHKRLYKFASPNQPISQMNEYEIYDMSESQIEQASKITPSPLGKYYFELSDNKSVYIEFFPRIYPSITNPPKGWSKEMMQKLDLKLE